MSRKRKAGQKLSGESPQSAGAPMDLKLAAGDSERFLSPNEIGRIMNVTGEAVKQWIHQRRLPAIKLENGYWKVKQSDFESFLKSRRAVTRRRVLVSASPGNAMPEVFEAIERLGHQALQAHNLADALLKALDHHPALIVIDLSREEIEPWKLAEKIRATKALKHMPILLLSDSNLADEPSMNRAIKVSAQAFLHRPFKTDTIAEEIERILNRTK